MKHILDANLNSLADLIELEPFGVTAGIDKSRPVMLFREKNAEAVLPVWLSAVDAGIALTQHNAQAFAMSPHDLPLQALDILGVRPVTCVFSELRGHQQYVELHFSGSRKLKMLKSRADHAISFCLQAKVKFYCTRGYLVRCREIEVEMGQTKMALNNKSVPRRNRHLYLN
jgi:hypothetical protein